MYEEIRKRIVDEAMSWIPTPFHDGAGVKHVGTDCAYFPLRVYQAVGLIDPGYEPEWYSPQKWLNSPAQRDRFHLRFEDTTMLDIVGKLSKRELLPPESPKPGDLMLCKVINSWTHGALVVYWPELVLHPIRVRGVVGSHALKEGFWANTPKRFFSWFEE